MFHNQYKQISNTLLFKVFHKKKLCFHHFSLGSSTWRWRWRETQSPSRMKPSSSPVSHEQNGRMRSQWDRLKLGSLGCCKGMAAEMISIDMTERFAKIILRHVFGSAYSCFNCVKLSLALKKTCGGWSWSKQELDSTPGHTPRCFGTWIVIIYCCVLSSVIVLVKSLWTKWDLNVSWNIIEVASKPIPLNIASPLDSLYSMSLLHKFNGIHTISVPTRFQHL